jgi:non-ribosomal peptide synthetase component F
LIWATSAFNLVANSGVLQKNKPKYLKKVILGGEALLATKLNIWRQALPKVKYINLYGPTEVTVDCTYYIIDREFADNEEIPIGKACENKEVILLSQELKEVEIGEVGEICVRGIGLAKGYYNDFEKTKNAFIQNPNNPYYTDIIYKTGDLGYKDKEGYIFFKYRKDAQIKHMGYRIELDEIEVAINSNSNIKNAICFYDEEANKIVCIYEGDISDFDLVKYLQNIIPKYMLPNVYKCVDRLFYNANGKIDRVKHKKIYLDEK